MGAAIDTPRIRYWLVGKAILCGQCYYKKFIRPSSAANHPMGFERTGVTNPVVLQATLWREKPAKCAICTRKE